MFSGSGAGSRVPGGKIVMAFMRIANRGSKSALGSSPFPAPCSRHLVAFALIAFASSSSADTLTLGAVLREALEKNPAYQASRSDRAVAENAHSSAGLAGYLPTVTATARHTRSTLDTRQERDTAVTTDPAALSTTTSAGVTANWTLFEGFAAPLEQKRLRLRREQAEAAERASREALLRRAALAYAALARQALLRRARDTVLAVSEERTRILD